MSTVMKELKAEIARVARRVVRKEVAALQRSNAAHRGFIADLRRQILNLQKEIKAQARGPAASELPVAGDAAAAKRFWITGKGIRALRKRLSQEQQSLEGGMTFLATIGSTAPFIGLFGTVWGIYNALVNIGAQGQVSIGTVAGPIGEALVATAAGLAAAIPAVLAYNTFTRLNRLINQDMDHFTHDLHAHLITLGGKDGIR